MSARRSTSNFLFPTLTNSRKLLLHFRFIYQAFSSNLFSMLPSVATLIPFWPDYLVAIRPHLLLMNELLNLLTSLNLLSVILSSKTISSMLVCWGLVKKVYEISCDIVLNLAFEFTIVVGELHRGRLEEYQAAPLTGIEDLFQRFRTKMATFVRFFFLLPCFKL